jgi:hypothetical protein
MSNHDIESEADSQETTTGTHIHAETETYRYKDFNGKITCHEPDLIVSEAPPGDCCLGSISTVSEEMEVLFTFVVQRYERAQPEKIIRD